MHEKRPETEVTAMKARRKKTKLTSAVAGATRVPIWPLPLSTEDIM